jgi:hypothetical protein
MKNKTTERKHKETGRRAGEKLYPHILRHADGSPVTTVKRARELVGGFSNPSKMPCYGFSIPASKCNVGSKLRAMSGSTCSDCYACKGLYDTPCTIEAMERRYTVLMLALSTEKSAEAYARLFSKALGRSEYFRWHDSGDLQSIWHLVLIVRIAELRPDVEFWLPTREYKIVREYLRERGSFPTNLTVRVSAAMRDDYAPQIVQLDDTLPTSGVHDNYSALGTECPAYQNDGACGDCRMCWSQEAHVSYPRH